MLELFIACAVIIVLLEPKLIGALIYWTGLLAVGFVGLMALAAWVLGS